MGHTTLRLLLVLVIMIFSASPDKAEAAEIPSQPVLGGTQGGVPPCSSPASTNSTCGINRTLVYRATIDHTQPTAFIFDWADGTTLRDPETGFANAVNGVVQGAFVLHHWVAAGIFGVAITAIDNLGDTSTSAPVEITILPPPLDAATGVATPLSRVPTAPPTAAPVHLLVPTVSASRARRA